MNIFKPIEGRTSIDNDSMHLNPTRCRIVMIQPNRQHVISVRYKIGTNGAWDPDPQSIERPEEIVCAFDRPQQHIEHIAMSFILAGLSSTSRNRLSVSHVCFCHGSLLTTQIPSPMHIACIRRSQESKFSTVTVENS